MAGVPRRGRHDQACLGPGSGRQTDLETAYQVDVAWTVGLARCDYAGGCISNRPTVEFRRFSGQFRTSTAKQSRGDSLGARTKLPRCREILRGAHGPAGKRGLASTAERDRGVDQAADQRDPDNNAEPLVSPSRAVIGIFATAERSRPCDLRAQRGRKSVRLTEVPSATAAEKRLAVVAAP